MTASEERRTLGVTRVPHQSIVELCGIDDDGPPAFEGETVDVSGRGMRVRSAFAPETGTELVTRFESDAGEVLAEGVTSWRMRHGDGWQFGVRFTAVDSNSVGVLRALAEACERDERPSEPGDPPEPEEVALPAVQGGESVRLHLEGMSAALKGVIQEARRSRARVAVRLDYLKLERSTRIELGGRGSRDARLRTLELVVDPASQVPHLLLGLAYTDVDDVTPEPTAAPTDEALALGDEEAEDDGLLDGGAADEGEAAPFLGGRLAPAARLASTVARGAGVAISRVGGSAAEGFARLMARRASAAADAEAQRGVPVARPRTSRQPIVGRADAPARPARVAGNRAAAPEPPPRVAGVRGQRASAEPPAIEPGIVSRLVRRVPARSWGLLGATALILAGATYAFRGASEEPPRAAVVDPEPRPAAEAPGPTPLLAEGAPAPELAAAPTAAPEVDDGEVQAKVPLFGPRSLATAEPAGGGDEPEVALSRAVRDETFADGASGPAAGGGKTEFQRGRLDMPVAYHLRLDAPGTVLLGERLAHGFVAVIPGRKVMESGAAIARSDPRIASVEVTNDEKGARITFRFRDEVPPYKVRLKNDFVEFMVNPPASATTAERPR